MPVAISGRGTAEADWMGWNGWSGMPELSAAAIVRPGGKAVFVAPHPDDEVLGCGALIAALAGRGIEIVILAVTDGEAAYPGADGWAAPRLANVRRDELAVSLALLGVEATIRTLSIADGAVARHEGALIQALARYTRPADTIFSTWHRDGHPDHEATGRACAHFAAVSGARHVEVPIWAWHWAAPEDRRFPWDRARRYLLSPREQQR
jgi:LmbE family N-acetylglucosaminyl deacetylase